MTISGESLEKSTEAFFAAIAQGHWSEAMGRIHPSASAVQYVSGQEVNARELLQSMQAMVESLEHFAYENPRRVVGQDAVVEEHVVCMTPKSGKPIRLDVCIILRFDAEGRIIRIDEYFDSASVARLQASES